MRVILLGAPGSGKGTQAKLICENLKVPHISTGDIFRDNISKNTILGIQAKGFMEKGELVPDEITIAAVRDRLQEEDCRRGFLLDGFPRNINQARHLQQILIKGNHSIDAVFEMEASSELLLERLAGRRYCNKCGSSYNIKSKPSKVEGVCDCCGESLVQREDDREEVILERLAVYNKTIDPLVKYYSSMGILHKIEVSNDINDVFSTIYNTLRAV